MGRDGGPTLIKRKDSITDGSVRDVLICQCGYIVLKLLTDQARLDFGCPKCGTLFEEFRLVTQLFKRFSE